MSIQAIVESYYNGICDIYEYQEMKNPKTHIVTSELVKVHEGIKCRLLFKSFPEAKDGVINGIKQQVKLLITPSLSIKEGSYFEVIQNGVLERYQNSGKAAIYTYHQEINLIAVDRFV